jgi:iron complex transport system substrate-binding protein
MMDFPNRIICLTEESVESLYLLGKESLIQGVSEYVMRPPEAKLLPKVSQFLRSDYDAIENLNPDLVLGYSDIQKDIAKELVGRGLNVFITQQRSLEEILQYILLLGRIVGADQLASDLVSEFRKKMDSIRIKGEGLPTKPKVYFEEWDRPRFSGSLWLSEMIEICGGINIFTDRTGKLAREREVFDQEIIALNPDVILACWCGKKVEIEKISTRENYQHLSAIKNNEIYELDPAVFLQPGPALFIDGLDKLSEILSSAALDIKKRETKL